jgi:hypothetical protein
MNPGGIGGRLSLVGFADFCRLLLDQKKPARLLLEAAPAGDDSNKGNY